ncbi:WhiB family transcriptional regulator [Streptomyces olivaceoviridis]|uniref:WhiB family transcriptional regulator n=1 Tax=Streptomyces olivaceoviridis TaxID=1921 RepID=UPI0036FAB943
MGAGWEGQAACRGLDPALFYPAKEQAEQVKRARAVCEECPVRKACLAAALADENGLGPSGREGVRGGLTGRERYLLERGQLKPVRRAARKPRTAPRKGWPAPMDREHGTPRGARQHWKYNELVCDACRAAYNAWQSSHRANWETSNCHRAVLPEDLRRRVEELLSAGHSDWSVHRETGVARGTIARYRRKLSNGAAV